MKRSTFSIRPLVLFTALAASGMAHVQAQSLVQLYESARAYDAAYQSAKSQYEANLAKADQAMAGIYPTANLSAGVTRSLFENSNPAVDRGFTSQNATVSANQPLYRPGNWATYEIGRASCRERV